MNLLPIASDRSYYLNTKYNNDPCLYYYQKNFIDYVANNHTRKKMYLLMFEAGTGKTLAYLKLCERMIIHGIYKNVFIITRNVLFAAIKKQIPKKIVNNVNLYTFISFAQDLKSLDLDKVINNSIIIFDEIQLALGEQDNENKETGQTRLKDFRNICTNLFFHASYNNSNMITIFSTATVMVNSASNIINLANVFFKYQYIRDNWFGESDEDQDNFNKAIKNANNQVNNIVQDINDKITYYDIMIKKYYKYYNKKNGELVENSNQPELIELLYIIQNDYSLCVQYKDYLEKILLETTSVSASAPTNSNLDNIIHIDYNRFAPILQITNFENSCDINENNIDGNEDDTENINNISRGNSKNKTILMNIPVEFMKPEYCINNHVDATNFIIKYLEVFSYKNKDDIIDKYIVNPFITFDVNTIMSEILYKYSNMSAEVQNSIYNDILNELNKTFFIPMSRIQHNRNKLNHDYMIKELYDYGIMPDTYNQSIFEEKNSHSSSDSGDAFNHDANLKFLKLFYNYYEYQFIDCMLANIKNNSSNMTIETYITLCCDVIAKVNPMIAFIVFQVLSAYYKHEPGMSIIYFEDQVQHGMKEFGLCLELINKYSPDNSVLNLTDITKSGPTSENSFKYCMVDGKTCLHYNSSYREKFNSAENVNGMLCNLVIFSKVFKEGVSFSNVLRKFYPVFSWNQTTKYQVEHRTLRSDSFKHFTPEILKSDVMKNYLDENGKIYPHNYTLVYSNPNYENSYFDYDTAYFDEADNMTYFSQNYIDWDGTEKHNITFTMIYDIWNPENILYKHNVILYNSVYLDILMLYVKKQQEIDLVNTILNENKNQYLVKEEDTSNEFLAHNIFDLIKNINNKDVNIPYMFYIITRLLYNGTKTIGEHYNAYKNSDYMVMPCSRIGPNITNVTRFPTMSKTNNVEYRSITQAKNN